MFSRFPMLLAATMLAAPFPSAAQPAPDPLPVGTCINMGNSLEPLTENGWGGEPIRAEDFVRIKDAGFETVRIPVRWHAKSSDTAPYTIEPAWLDRVAGVVDMALDAELKVILNSHHFEPVYAEPEASAPWLAGVWSQVAARFADRPTDRLWFEIENEPHDQLTNANLVAVLSPSLAAIRATNPDRAVIVGGENWSGIDSLATLELPQDANIHPTFHYYEPFDFTHQGAEWAGDPPPAIGREYGTAADAQRLVTDVAKLEAYIERTGRTPFMGETGAYDAHIPLEQRVTYHRAIRDAFAPLDIGMCAWAYANTFPFWDRDSGDWLPGLRGAMGLPDGSGAAAPAPTASPPAAAQSNGALPAPQRSDLSPELQALDDQLPGTLANDPTGIDWDTYGSDLRTSGFADETIPGGAANVFEVRRAGVPHSAGANVPLTIDIRQGDQVTIGFFARTKSSTADDGMGRMKVRFQQNREPYPGFGDSEIAIGSDWNWYEVSAIADRPISRAEAIVAFQFGTLRQELEIGQAIAVIGAARIVGAPRQ